MRERISENKGFYGQLGALAVPMIFQYFMLAAVGAGDAAMLGHVSQDALAAVSLAGQVQFVLNLFWGAITGGVTMMTAQYWGERNKAGVYWTFCMSVQYTLAVSAVFSALAVAVPELLMGIFTDEPVLIGTGAEYLRMTGVSYLFAGLSQCCHAVLKTTGRAKRGAVISICCLLLDVGLNAVFIFGLFGLPAMGTRGAALTTVLTRLLEMLLVGNALPIQPDWYDILHPSPGVKREFRHYSAPILLNSLVWGLGTAAYAVIIGHLGSDAAAANAAAAVIRDLVNCLCLGLSNGGGILLGNLLGAGDLDGAKKYGGRLSVLSVVCGFVCAAAVLLIAAPAVPVLPLTDTARYYLGGMLGICAFYMIGRSVNAVVVCGVFHAGGDTMFNAVSVALSMWLFVIPFACAAAFWWKWPVLAVYLIISLDEVIKLPWVCRHYKKYKWVRNITKEEGL